MIAKVVVTIVVALATMVLYRQFSERKKRATVPIKNKNSRSNTVKNLVWDEKSRSYRAED